MAEISVSIKLLAVDISSIMQVTKVLRTHTQLKRLVLVLMSNILCTSIQSLCLFSKKNIYIYNLMQLHFVQP